MQSQLAAALMGHNTNQTSTPTNQADDDNNCEREEDTEIEHEEFEEDVDNEPPAEPQVDNNEKHHLEIRQIIGKDPTNRTVTLQMLLSTGILKPETGAMTIEYLGQKFVGDLLEDGKIRSQETDIVFASPSAWAIACKRFINPDKKSGCGWASVKYKGKKLDAYKNVWYKKKKEEEKQMEKEAQEAADNLHLEQMLDINGSAGSVTTVPTSNATTNMSQRLVVKHNTIASRTITHDANVMIECVPFSNLGKIQPFLISLHTNAAFLMDFHCHLTKSEVCGYLAGTWDMNTHTLEITRAFPCCNVKSDRANAHQIEAKIAKSIEKEKLSLVGWYHSHPFAAAAPTLRDVDAQLDYQIKLRGVYDHSYTPCIGFIISPYNYKNVTLESSIMAYWVIPPPETKPNEYGRPMLMSYNVIQDNVLTAQVKEEITNCVQYYEEKMECIDFTEKYNGSISYIDKLKSTMISKFPRDENEADIWKFLREKLKCSTVDGKETFSTHDMLGLIIPSVTKSNQILPDLPTSLVPTSGITMIPSDISSLLFNAGKFSSSNNLLGLPDPLAHSTLAANNMFLQSNLFKMQELLKPHTPTSNNNSNKCKNDAKFHISTPVKMATDVKPTNPTDCFPLDFAQDLKDKMPFFSVDLNLTTKPSNEKELLPPPPNYVTSIMRTNKMDYFVPNINLTPKIGLNSTVVSSHSEFISNLPKPASPTIIPTSIQAVDEKKLSKIPKIDFTSSTTLDLSCSKLNLNVPNNEKNTSVESNSSTNNQSSCSETNVSEQQPLNLT